MMGKDDNQRNMILAIVLSAVIFLGWQYFVGLPQMEKQRQAQQQQQQQQTQQPAPGATPAQPGQTPQPGVTAPAAPAVAAVLPRDQALAASGPRVGIETPKVRGSIALKGGRIDDLSLATFRESVRPNSPNIVLLAPSGTEHPFYAEFGWVSDPAKPVKVPDAQTVWTQQGSGPLTPTSPITLTWDNGEGVVFTRRIAIDSTYLFTVQDTVENKSGQPVSLLPYGLVSRHGQQHVQGYYVLHEGFIGVTGDGKSHEEKYAEVETKKRIAFPKAAGGWLGITDKYWAAAVIPDPAQPAEIAFSAPAGGTKIYQADYLGDARTIEPGQKGENISRLFAGAKEVAVVDAYDKTLGVKNFDLLIDWGHLYFITKPMFKLIDLFFRWTGNFGIAILVVTLLVKIVFFPLANKSYASMAKMKKVQPEMTALRERYPDDKVKQQQEMMALYKREKINPLAGCLPILIQIPVFFALYKVLFVTIEMRHAPFFGWIRDLSAPDPTSVFNLFGLIPWDPGTVPVIGHFLLLGAWPIVMGITMWVQMKMNPAPPDPTQKMIFDWMPIIFTFMLASFPAGLVIYWTWNNTLSVLQQYAIMRKNGVKVELWDNIRAVGAKKKPADT